MLFIMKQSGKLGTRHSARAMLLLKPGLPQAMWAKSSHHTLGTLLMLKWHFMCSSRESRTLCSSLFPCNNRPQLWVCSACKVQYMNSSWSSSWSLSSTKKLWPWWWAMYLLLDSLQHVVSLCEIFGGRPNRTLPLCTYHCGFKDVSIEKW